MRSQAVVCLCLVVASTGAVTPWICDPLFVPQRDIYIDFEGDNGKPWNDTSTWAYRGPLDEDLAAGDSAMITGDVVWQDGKLIMYGAENQQAQGTAQFNICINTGSTSSTRNRMVVQFDYTNVDFSVSCVGMVPEWGWICQSDAPGGMTRRMWAGRLEPLGPWVPPPEYLVLNFEFHAGAGGVACLDNLRIGVLYIPDPGDVDGNGVVDGLDLTAVLSAWETVPGDPLWNPAADLDCNGVVDGLDLTEVISNWTTASAAAPASEAAPTPGGSGDPNKPGAGRGNVHKGKGSVRLRPGSLRRK